MALQCNISCVGGRCADPSYARNGRLPSSSPSRRRRCAQNPDFLKQLP